MSESESKSSLTLPEELRRQFDAVRSRLWAVETAAAVSCGVGALGASALVLFVSDRLWDTPVWARVGLFAVGASGAALAAGFVPARRAASVDPMDALRMD